MSKFSIRRVRRFNGVHEWVLDWPPRCWSYWTSYCTDREGRVLTAHSSFASAVAQMNRALVRAELKKNQEQKGCA